MEAVSITATSDVSNEIQPARESKMAGSQTTGILNRSIRLFFSEKSVSTSAGVQDRSLLKSEMESKMQAHLVTGY